MPGHNGLASSAEAGGDMGERRFRFGVIGEDIRTSEQLASQARRAEALGFSTLLLRDHFVTEPFGEQFAPLVGLMAAAAATTSLRVGTLVLDNDYRHPVLLAKEVTSLDVLSGGRFELGLGAGWLRDEYDRAGLTFDPAGVRVDRLEESVQLLKRLLGGEEVSYDGKHYSIGGLRTFPRPAQRPHPPILLGAGSRRMLGIAGREGDIVNILPKALPEGTISDDLAERSPETIERKVGWVREAAGERFEELELGMIVSVAPGADARAAAERRAVERGWGAEAAERVLEMPSVLAGPVERVVDRLQAHRERLGLSYYVVSSEDVELAAPVVERLAGR
jgi:probable F420-dependent oxidoreductase